MTTKYKKYPIPFEAWKNFKLKQEKMSETLRRITGKNKTVPLSKIILVSSQNTLWLDDKEISGLSKRRRGYK